tara:strand:+ start:828 stop:2081 length:1254 start_codon:yes stop_codon:yes gene_type:complete
MGKDQFFFKELSWEELAPYAAKETDLVNGLNNSYSKLRLFGTKEQNVRVTLFRDHHAWCPYCQKVWLWLEWKRIPYKIKKVTMRCYGRKEDWYLKKVPSGILPALEIDNQLFTESDNILVQLEKIFGPLGLPIEENKTVELRILERKLFRAWCIWLCQPSLFENMEIRKKNNFQNIAREMETNLTKSTGVFLDPITYNDGKSYPGTADIVFIPYLERMNASLAYYKGFKLREEHPAINSWLGELEKSNVYRGSQGDFHTHAHDLPPQMGGCYTYKNTKQSILSSLIDNGTGLGEIETTYSAKYMNRNETPESIALARVIKHKDKIKETNPMNSESFDQPLRASLTRMICKRNTLANAKSASGLRYLKDRISVPRDMPLLSARSFRQALEETAKLDGIAQGPTISTKDRFDQNPQPFL